MTVLELMRSGDRGLVDVAEMMHQRFGCPGKNFPCIKVYASGKKICEGCWVNFFSTQVPELQKGEAYERKSTESV